MHDHISFVPTVEETYHRLLNHIPGMAYRCRVEKVLESDGIEHFEYILEFVSQGSLSLLGIAAEDMIEKNQNVIEQMTHPDDLSQMRKEIYDKVVAHQSYQVMYRLLLPNGIVKWIWDQGEGVYGPDDGLWYLEGLMMDVSEQKFMELHLREENRQFRLSSSRLLGLGGLVGQSESMRHVYELILKAAETDTNVIIYGETGSGKDVAARAIHALSGKKGAYIPVNCGAIPETLMESEFFGHIKGAFTGATSHKEGYIHAADGGTLFLDEIGELPLHLQVKLLRTLENRMYTPVGGHTPQSSSFRLVAATNQDLKNMVKEKRMRADFYYRVHVLAITLPPLRERLGDLPLLMAAWKERRNIQIDIPLHVRLAMEHYFWPGNVRELYNFLDRYAAFGDSALDTLGEAIHSSESIFVSEYQNTHSLEEAIEVLEERYILKALEECHWHRGEAALKLGLNLRTMQRKMKKLGISRKKL
jgi:transcriptional regulator with PAS, ATPase and Fis domain